MPISAQQWRVKTGMINASRGVRPISIKPPAPLFTLPSPPPSEWKGYSAAMVMLCLPLLCRIYAVGLAVWMYLARGGPQGLVKDYSMAIGTTSSDIRNRSAYTYHPAQSVGSLILFYFVMVVLLVTLRRYRDRDKRQLNLKLLEPLHHVNVACLTTVRGPEGSVQVKPKMISGCIYSKLELDPQSILQCVRNPQSSAKHPTARNGATCMGVVSFILQLSTLVVAMLLLLAGDVERNPGPPPSMAIKTLVNELQSVKDKYSEIGIQLGIELSVILTIELQHPTIDRRLTEILMFWLDGNARVPVCWESIASALENVGKVALAEQLRAKYCVTSMTQSLSCKLSQACLDEQKDAVIKLLKQGADPNSDEARDQLAMGRTPLHFACQYGWMDVVGLLIEEYKCNPETRTYHGSGMTPLHYACQYGRHEIVKLLIEKFHCNPNVRDSEQMTPLHYACQFENHEVLKVLVNMDKCDPSAKNKDGLTPLQITTDTRIIRELIRHGADAEDVYKIYGRSLKRPLQPAVKVFIVGNPSAGKSTLTAALQKESSFLARTFTPAQKVKWVDAKTAGVVPHDFESKEYGYTTLYDFAGQREFYGSHAALLQNAILNQSSPPVFLIVVDLREREEEITQTILYWLTFLENQCASVSDKPHVIIVGSHADVLRARGKDPELKTNCLDKDIPIFSKFVFVGFIAMDCQYPKSRDMDKLRQCLKSSCSALRPKKNISFNAHCFYVYLIDKFKDSVAVTVEQIQAQIKADQALRQVTPKELHNLLSFIPDNLHHLYKICVKLDDRGHVLFLKDSEAIEKSWVVIDKGYLLAKFSGSIFAPEHFKQHVPFTTGSTGVVPLSSIARHFPDQDPKVLIKFLLCFEFCHEISDPEILQIITAEHQTVSGLSHSLREHYFLFPALVSLNVPAHVWDDKRWYTHYCGWILRCSTERPEQFFTSRFLQVLLLRMAFSFSLSEGDMLHSNPAIQRKCSIWKNGIFWGDRSGVETLVEVVPDNKAVIVLMRCSDLTNLIQLRSQVIRKVLHATKEFCPAIETVESFIDPSETAQYPLEPASQLKLFSVSNTARAVLDTNPPSASVVSPIGSVILLDRLVPCEPYAGLGEDILWEMFEERDQDIEKIPDSSLSRIAQVMGKNPDLFITMFTPEHEAHNTAMACDILSVLKTWRAGCAGTYKSLRERLDGYSVFAGRDPLALAGETGRQQRSKHKNAQSDQLPARERGATSLKSTPSMPNNFSWFVDDKLAAMSFPDDSHIPSLAQLGIRKLINFSNEAADYLEVAKANGISVHHIPVETFHSPTMDQVQEFLDIVLPTDELVGVHCTLGIGRTGTFLACYLIATKGYTATQAIKETRKRRPNSVETEDQERGIHEFEMYWKEKDSMSKAAILDEALKKGYVLLHITKVVISGSAGNGKTHTKYVLFNELDKLEEAQKSTPLFDVPVRALSREIVGTDLTGCVWYKVTYDELNKMLACSIEEGVEMEGEEVQPVASEETTSSPLWTNHEPPDTKPTKESTPQASEHSTHGSGAAISEQLELKGSEPQSLESPSEVINHRTLTVGSKRRTNGNAGKC